MAHRTYSKPRPKISMGRIVTTAMRIKKTTKIQIDQPQTAPSPHHQRFNTSLTIQLRSSAANLHTTPQSPISPTFNLIDAPDSAAAPLNIHRQPLLQSQPWSRSRPLNSTAQARWLVILARLIGRVVNGWGVGRRAGKVRSPCVSKAGR